MAKPAGSLWKRAPGVLMASLLWRPSYSNLIRAFLLTSSYSSLIGSRRSLITEWLILFCEQRNRQAMKFCCWRVVLSFQRLQQHSTLQIGHSMKPKVIRGPSQRFSSTRRVHCRWKTWVQSSWKMKPTVWHHRKAKRDLEGEAVEVRATCSAGAAERASVKQIIHMSSASCFRQPAFLSQPCRHGRQESSFLTPPHGCPQGWVLLQASFAYSWGRWWKRMLKNYSRHSNSD